MARPGGSGRRGFAVHARGQAGQAGGDGYGVDRLGMGVAKQAWWDRASQVQSRLGDAGRRGWASLGRAVMQAVLGIAGPGDAGGASS